MQSIVKIMVLFIVSVPNQLHILLWLLIYYCHNSMFEFTKENLSSQLALSTFRDEVMHKVMLVDQFAFEFEKLGFGKSAVPKRIVEFVKLSRRTIQETENMLCGFHTYLSDLRLQFFSDLLVKMFRLLIVSLNGVSVRLIHTINNSKTVNKATEHQETVDLSPPSNYNDKAVSRNKAKKLEYCDFVIKNLQEEELRLDQKKRMMQKQLSSGQGKSLQNITASDTVNQLEHLSRDINKIIANTYRVSSENVITRYQQVSRRMLELTKPQDIKNEFCSQLSSNVKEKFMTTMERIINEMYIEIRRKQRQAVFDQIEASKPKKADLAVQTDYDAKLKQIEQLTRQKKTIILDLQSMKKSNALFQKQNEKLVQKLKQAKQGLRIHEKKSNEIEQSYNKKQAEFISAREQWEITLKLKKEEIEKLERRISHDQMSTVHLERTSSEVEPYIPNSKLEDPFAEDGNENKMNSSTKSSKYKAYVGQRANNSFLIEKELQTQKKQNVVLRSSFESLINKLQHCKLIHPANPYDLFRQLKMGTFSDKIDEILQEIVCNISMPKQNAISLKQSKLKSSKKLKEQIFTRYHAYGYKQISVETQTHDIDIQFKESNANENLYMDDGKRNSNKLEALKRQFLERVSRKKKSNRYAVRQLTKNNITNETHDHSDFANKTMMSINPDDNIDQRLSMSKPKPQKVNKKDISFQQFKLMKVAKNDNSGDKKVANKLKKSIMKEKMQEQVTSKPIISIETYQVLKEVKAITDMIEAKKDGKDYFLTSFIKNLLEQFKKMKGDIYIEDFLRKELNEIFMKSNARNSIKPAQTKYFNFELNNMR